MSANKSAVRSTKPGQTHVTGPGRLNAPAFAKWYRDQTIRQWKALDLKAVAEVAAIVEAAEREGRTIYVIGNGGSAATASHVACDLSKTAARPGRPLVRCVALTDNAAFMTAIGNDLSYDDLFSRQLENILEARDVVILITGSGNSPNLIKAAKLANARGAITVGWLGFDGGALAGLVKTALLVPCDQYGVIEDMHLAINHILTFYLKQRK
jgi:D-sedoheptulose 7-phosphate isomerase